MSLNACIDLPPTYQVSVETVDGRGFTTAEIAESCASKIVEVADNADPLVKAQAYAFKNDIVKVIEYYMKEVVKSERTTVCNAITNAGHKNLSELIRRL